MLGFFKKKDNKPANDHLYAVASGELIPIDQVNDPVFSQKMMGDGFAVIPDNGKIYSPVEGTVVSVFQTKHAVGFKMNNGLEILLHMGIDTVELNGAPFDIKVSEGSKVAADTLIADVDLDKIRGVGKPIDMIVVITNMDAVASFDLTKTGRVEAGEEAGTAKAN